MGTLLNQPERQRKELTSTHLIDATLIMKNVAEKCRVSIDQVIEIAKYLETQRQNDLFIDDGDRKDEQLAGFGEILGEIRDSLEQKV